MRVPSTLDPDGQLDSTYVDIICVADMTGTKVHYPFTCRIGMLYLGVVLSAMLYGICVLQSFLYFQSRPLITSNGTSFLTEVKSTRRIHGTSKLL